MKRSIQKMRKESRNSDGSEDSGKTPCLQRRQDVTPGYYSENHQMVSFAFLLYDFLSGHPQIDSLLYF